MVRRWPVGERDTASHTSAALEVLWYRVCLRRRGGDRAGRGIVCSIECIASCFRILSGRKERVVADGGERRKLGHLSSNSGRGGKVGVSAASTIKGRERAVHK